MTDSALYVAHIVNLNGGRIVGKTRLQKTLYLLESADLGYGFDFDYHHYGPFSVDLAHAADEAEDFRYLSTEENRGHHYIPYVVYETRDDFDHDLKDSADERRREMLDTMSRYSAVELELAATAVWLQRHGFKHDVADELKRLKPEKATDARVDRAINLGTELGVL